MRAKGGGRGWGGSAGGYGPPAGRALLVRSLLVVVALLCCVALYSMWAHVPPPSPPPLPIASRTTSSSFDLARAGVEELQKRVMELETALEFHRIRLVSEAAKQRFDGRKRPPDTQEPNEDAADSDPGLDQSEDDEEDAVLRTQRHQWQESYRNRQAAIKSEYERIKVLYADRQVSSNSFQTHRKSTGRLFVSKAIDDIVTSYKSRMKDSELAWLFENCLPNTVDTTVKHEVIKPEDSSVPELDTFIITGDINAMWLRDSTNQVWPYIALAKEDPKLKDMLKGLINRQVRSVLLDAYANAFLPTKVKGPWARDKTKMLPGVHERKYELDSVASVIRLSVGYYEATGDVSVFDKRWLSAMDLLVNHIKANQKTHGEYKFQRSSQEPTETLQHGYGRPGKLCGMSQSPFRPSDDASTFPYPVAANAMTAVWLRRMITHGLLDDNSDLVKRASSLVEEIEDGIQRWGIVRHPIYGRIFAYEVDGRGSAELMDDANLPSLLSLPYLEFLPVDDEVYQRTRHFLLSTDNPWFFNGTAAHGIGSPHANGPNFIWPMSIIVRALTSTQDEEIMLCLEMLKATHGGTGFMHETFNKDNPKKFTRTWFAWANTLFGELIMKVGRERPHLLFR